MRVFPMLTVLACLGSLAVLSACVAKTTNDSTDCGLARNILGACGVSAALLDTEECEGVALLVAECIVEHAGSCDELSTIRVDDCASDLNIPASSFPLDGLSLLTAPIASEGP